MAHHGWRYYAFQSSGTSDGFAVNLHAERGDADVDGRHARDLDERTKSAESDKIDSV